MFRILHKSPLRSGLYHLALVLVAGQAFNWGFFTLTGIDIAGRVFTGVQNPLAYVSLAVCISAVIVLWNNWVD